MEAELIQELMQGSAGFSLWHSENFARIAKILQSLRKFAIIGKVTVHSENSNFRYACNFCYDSENHCVRNFLLLYFFDPNDFVFGFSHFYPLCNYSSFVILVFHMFVRLHKPL